MAIRPDDVRGLFGRVREAFGSPEVFATCARPELATFYQPPLGCKFSLSSRRDCRLRTGIAVALGGHEAGAAAGAAGAGCTSFPRMR